MTRIIKFDIGFAILSQVFNLDEEADRDYTQITLLNIINLQVYMFPN